MPHLLCQGSAFLGLTNFFTLSGSYVGVLLAMYLFMRPQVRGSTACPSLMLS